MPEKFDFYSPVNLKAYNLDDVMKYQLSMLDSMDPFTRKHSENVGNLVCRICEYLRCNKVFTIHATICGYLHDIGKLFIPTKILTKPGRLTQEEFEVMKTHTTLGYDMCMKDLKLRPYAEGPLYHHEALNGTGYPQGLTKKNIPYVAQIIRVADEYDALVTKRHYKTHVHISDTLRDLIKDTKPEEHIKSVALDQLAENYRFGKIDAKILRTLFKVVIDDTYYEISCLYEYLEYLNTQIKRLETAYKYYEKMNKAKKEKDYNYYKDGVRLLLQHGETIDNFMKILDEYYEAVKERKELIGKLHNEIKIIKKLRV